MIDKLQDEADLWSDFYISDGTKELTKPLNNDKMTPIKIEWSGEGWAANVGGRRYRWDHRDEDMGTEALSTLLRDLGYNVVLIEDY